MFIYRLQDKCDLIIIEVLQNYVKHYLNYIMTTCST